MTDGIKWVAESELFDLGYGFLFAKEIDPSELVVRLGGEQGLIGPLTRIEVNELEFRIREESRDQIVRIGSQDGWVFAFAEYTAVGKHVSAIRAASTATSAISIFRTVNALRGFTYAEDGELICQFEPGIDPEMSGREPERFYDQFARVGLLGERVAELGGSSMLLALDVVESIFGLSLPRHELLAGALPAARIPG
jgi:hypothetical protein